MRGYDYIFYLTDESFDYPTGYGWDTETQYQPHGFVIDEQLDMNSFEGYGDYLEMNDQCHTLEQLRDYIVAHYKEIKPINETCRECFTSTMYQNDDWSNWENFDLLLKQIDEKIRREI